MKKYIESVEIERIANDISMRMYERTYFDGCSEDICRKTSTREQRIIYTIAKSALNTLNYAYCRTDESAYGAARAVLDCSEFNLLSQIPKCNSYLTLYVPLANHWNARDNDEM